MQSSLPSTITSIYSSEGLQKLSVAEGTEGMLGHQISSIPFMKAMRRLMVDSWISKVWKITEYNSMVSLSFVHLAWIASQQGERFNQPSYNPLVNPNASFTKSSWTTLISQRRTARCSKLAPDFLQRQESIGFLLPNEENMATDATVSAILSSAWHHILLLPHPPVNLWLETWIGWCHGVSWQHGGAASFQHLFTSFMKFSRRKGLWITVLRLFLHCNIEKHSTSVAQHRLTHRMPRNI